MSRLIINVENSCRTCLSTSGKLESISNSKLIKILYKVVPEVPNILFTDSLSKKICVTCKEKLLEFHRFQLTCILADKNVRALTQTQTSYSLITEVTEHEEYVVPERKDEEPKSPESPPDNFADRFDYSSESSEPEFNTRRSKRSSIKRRIITTRSMKLPQETHSESQRYECDNCHKIFRKKVEIIRHTIKHSQDFEESRIKTVDGALKENQCLICLDIVPNKNFLESHYKEHSIEDLICKICAHKSQTHIEFNQHCRSHPENFTFQCSICSKKILTQFSIVRHLLSHQKVISYACNLCERTFDTRRLLKEHIRKVRHPDNEFLCPLCGDKLASKKVLERHVIRHSGIKTLSCSLCPTKFYFNNDLKVHIASHSNVRKHICDICGASFNCNSSMRKHGRVHLDESEYKFACDVCGKKFSNSGSVIKHTRTHTGEKPYPCTEGCSKSFPTSGQMMKHLRTHLGKNIFRCKINNCKEAFPRRKDLKEHWPVHFSKNENMENLEDE